ncbi:MAG: GNAT family N-acetyltransferase [Acidimicrobiales bacterium]
MVEIRDIVAADVVGAVALNNAAVPAVNPHDEGSFAELLEMSDRSWVVDHDRGVGGLLVTFAPDASYRSANYVRLSACYDNFSYVDRIVVAPALWRRGLAARLYNTLADHARKQARTRLLCEVNVEPPNPRSVAFHEATGWQAIEDFQHGPGRVVRYFEFLL